MNKYIRVRRWAEQEPNMNMKYNEYGTGFSGGTQGPIETLYKELVIFTGEKSVQYLFNERLHGISKNNKHFFKFHTVRKIIYTIKPNAYGEMVGKFYFKEGRKLTNISKNLTIHLINMTGRYSDSSIGSDVFAAQVRKVAQAHALNVDDTLSVYDPAFTFPVLRHLEANQTTPYPSAITRYAATNDLSVFVRRAFGKTRYRKDLVKSVANLSSINVFMIGYSFRGLVPVDWIIDFYRKHAKKNSRKFSFEFFQSDLRGLLYKLPQKQVRKLFHLLTNDASNMKPYIIRDLFLSLDSMNTEDLYNGVEEIKFTTLEEAHDKYATHVRVEETKKRNAHYLEPLNMTDLAKQIDAIEYPSNADIKVRPALCAMDLVEWGSMMNHCIGSYTRDAINSQGTFGVITQHGKPIGNFHYNHRTNQLNQMFGKHNQELPTDVIVAVFKLLIENTDLTFKNLKNCSGTRSALSDPRILEFKKQAEYEEHYKKEVQYDRARFLVVNNAEGAGVNLDWQPLGHADNDAVVNVWDGQPWEIRQQPMVIRQQATPEQIEEYQRFVAQQQGGHYIQPPNMNW